MNKYYIHALLGYSSDSYVLKGPYYCCWFAKIRAHVLMASNPYGTALINQTTHKPKIINQYGVH